jgi:hypothetical protein
MRLRVGILVILVMLAGRSSRAGEVAVPPAPTVNAPELSPDATAAPPSADVTLPPVIPPPLVVPPPVIPPPPSVGRQLLLAPPDSEAIASAKALRDGGILLFAVGVPVTILSQVLLGVSIVKGLILDEADGPAQARADERARPYRIAAIVTTISGNIMIAGGLAMWGTANGQLRRKSRASTVGSLYAAPSTEGHGGAGGLVVHF